MIDQPLAVGFAGEHFDPGHKEHASAQPDAGFVSVP